MDPQNWGAYARLQTLLADDPVVDGQSWGLEAGLDRHLEALGEVSDDDTDRAVRSESRRERHRARLRRIYGIDISVPREVDSQVEARQRLNALRAMLSEADWLLLVAVGEGREYAEIATALGVTVEGLRVRVFRLRRDILGGANVGQSIKRAA